MHKYISLILGLLFFNGSLLFSMKRRPEDSLLVCPSSVIHLGSIEILPHEILSHILFNVCVDEDQLGNLKKSIVFLRDVNKVIKNVSLVGKNFSAVFNPNFTQILISEYHQRINKYTKRGHACIAEKIGTKNSQEYYNVNNNFLCLLAYQSIKEIESYFELNKACIEINYENYSCSIVNHLEAAITSRRPQTVSFVLDKGVDVHRGAKGGRSPIAYAVQQGIKIKNKYPMEQLSHIIKQLIQHKVSVDAYTTYPYSPLYIACFNDNIKIVDLLLLNGANPDKPHNEKLNKGWSYLLAGFHENNQMMNLLNKYKPLIINNSTRYADI